MAYPSVLSTMAPTCPCWQPFKVLFAKMSLQTSVSECFEDARPVGQEAGDGFEVELGQLLLRIIGETR